MKLCTINISYVQKQWLWNSQLVNIILLLLKVLSEDVVDFKALFRERALQFFSPEKGCDLWHYKEIAPSRVN